MRLGLPESRARHLTERLSLRWIADAARIEAASFGICERYGDLAAHKVLARATVVLAAGLGDVDGGAAAATAAAGPPAAATSAAAADLLGPAVGEAGDHEIY